MIILKILIITVVVGSLMCMSVVDNKNKDPVEATSAKEIQTEYEHDQIEKDFD